MSHIPEERWEERFDKEYPGMDKPCYCCGGGLPNHWNGGVKYFIRKLLADKEARVANILEGMKTKLTDEETKDLGQALWGYFDFSGMEETKATRIHEIIGGIIVSAKNNTLDAVKSKIIGNSK